MVARPANQLTLPPERRRSVTFRSHVLPLLQDRCSTCHGEPSGSPYLGTLDSETGRWATYQNLLAARGPGDGGQKPLIVPGSARKSRMIWSLFGRGSEQPTRIPAEHAGILSDEERRILVEWIDLGAQWDLPPESSNDQPGDAGP